MFPGGVSASDRRAGAARFGGFSGTRRGRRDSSHRRHVGPGCNGDPQGLRSASQAGFISKAWFPHFANYRRDGYDFDSRWDEELASMRAKRIMDQFGEGTEKGMAMMGLNTIGTPNRMGSLMLKMLGIAASLPNCLLCLDLAKNTR